MTQQKMKPSEQIPNGYVKRKEAAQIIGISASTFDKIAEKEFKHSRIRIGNGNAFYYSIQELETYRDFREKCKKSGQEELTWKRLVEENEKLNKQNEEFDGYIRTLVWVLRDSFPKDASTKFSAAYFEKTEPEKYKEAKQILSAFGLGIEELRKRFAILPTPPTSSRYSPPDLDF